MNPVLCGEWYFIKYDDNDMAKALILSEEISTTEVDKVKAHGKGHGELGEVSYLTGNVSKLRQIPNRKPWSKVWQIFFCRLPLGMFTLALKTCLF